MLLEEPERLCSRLCTYNAVVRGGLRGGVGGGAEGEGGQHTEVCKPASMTFTYRFNLKKTAPKTDHTNRHAVILGRQHILKIKLKSV